MIPNTIKTVILVKYIVSDTVASSIILPKQYGKAVCVAPDTSKDIIPVPIFKRSGFANENNRRKLTFFFDCVGRCCSSNFNRDKYGMNNIIPTNSIDENIRNK